MKLSIPALKSLKGSLLILATIFLSISSHAQAGPKGFVKMFDGKTLNGWKGDTSHWSVKNGTIVGLVTAENQLKTNTFLIWAKDEPADFEFTAEFRISKGGNSGINYRSELFENIPFALKGYQADIDGQNEYTGLNYEERGRTFLARRGEKAVIENDKKPVVVGNLGNADSLKAKIHEGWNSIRVVAKGNIMKHYINGILMSEFTDNDTKNRKMKGLLGLQAHVTPSMKVEYRKLYIKTL